MLAQRLSSKARGTTVSYVFRGNVCNLKLIIDDFTVESVVDIIFSFNVVEFHQTS